MAITTNSAHVSRALDFFNKNDIYFAIGKSSIWNETDTPPAPDLNTTDLLEIVGYKKVETVYLVKPDDDGSIAYRDSNWSVISPDQATAQGAKWVYLDTTLRYDELPLGYYRQVGLYTGLVPYQGRAEQSQIVVTAGCTTSGNISFNLGGTPLTIAVTAGMTIAQVVTKILSSAISGWTITAGVPSNSILFTHNAVGVQPNTIFTANSTGVACTVSTLQEGTDAVSASKANLLPSEVDANGILEVIDNRGATNRLIDQKEKLSLVIEF